MPASRVSTYPMFFSARHKPRRWPLVLRITKGSVHASVVPPVLFHSLFTALVVAIDIQYSSVALPGTTIIPSLSIVVGLMLVFRNGSSYDRFWTGRNHFTAVITATRNLTRYFLTYSRDAKGESTEAERADTESVIRILIAILYAAKHNLRSEFTNTDLTSTHTPPLLSRNGLTKSGYATPKAAQPEQLIDASAINESLGTLRPDYADLLPATLSSLEGKGLAMPLQLSVSVEAYIRRGVLRGWWAPPQASYINTQLSNLVSSYSAMETIRSTPIPVAYLIHARQVLALYLMVLPFAMVDDMVFWAVPIVALVAFTLYGIESIGRQLEDPFGYDKIDIKMDALVEDARVECDVLLEEWKSPNSCLFA
ncbi:Bestrophin domain containing protein [Venturia nashicola]|nr:Bestrophin domain containing protein [Venturia nashicola]